MHTIEKMPNAPTKRLGVDLNVDTGYKGKRRESISPPQTPEEEEATSKDNNTPPNRALNIQNGTGHTFLDDITPSDPSNKENDPENVRNNRDSHDLSLSPRQVTRDSLVDHMLLSLDQFSFGQEEFSLRNPTLDEDRLYTSFGDDEPYQSPQNFAARGGRGHAYSYSSDYDPADDSSRYSDKIPRSRRSNSSSNFQTGLARINSIRNDIGGSIRGPPIPHRGKRKNTGSSVGSKASSANSIDLGYAQVTSNQRWAHGLAGRSSSFDYGSDHRATSQSNLGTQMNIHVPPAYSYDYEAAPTPTVPGGPRRPRPTSPILVSRPDPTAIDPPMEKLERKITTKSSKSSYKPRGFTNPARHDYGLNDRSKELPPMPAFIKEQPTPSDEGYLKTKDAPQPVQSPTPVPKEKPGFFRKFFGSSRNNNVAAPEPPPSHGSTASTETADRSSNKTQIANQMKPHNVVPARETPQPPKEPPHVLTKKPSSFFRRRKKSVSEPESIPVPAMPMPPMNLEPHKLRPDVPDLQKEASPVSSLRQVMNPYLHSPGRPPIEAHVPTASLDRQINDISDDFERKRNVRGFSPDYEPDPNATIRQIPPSKPASSHAGDSRQPSYSSIKQPRRSASSNLATPGGFDGQAKEARETFSQDANENDRDAKSKLVPTKDVPGSTLLPTPVSPGHSPSVVRDMALVAEYERIHSKRSPTASKVQPEPEIVEPSLDSPLSTVDSKDSQELPTAPAKEEDWVVLTSSKSEFPEKDRVWIEPGSSEEDLPATNTLRPNRASSISATGSTDTIYRSAVSLPLLQVEGQEEGPSSPPGPIMSNREDVVPFEYPDSEEIDDTQPTEEDQIKAQKIYDGNEDFIQKEKATAWMGDEGPDRARTLTAYMSLYDFTNLNILASMRVICGRLVLKGESQQVDRILDAFSKRWCQSNSNHGFKTTDVVHTICYSVLLLNTDLHLADIEQKMTRSQFIKNTMPTIRRSVTESAHEFEPSRPTVLPGKSSAFDDPNDENADTMSIEVFEKPSWRSSFKPAPRQDSDNPNAPTPLDYDFPMDDCGPLVKAPFRGTLRTWEVQVEIVLKNFYNSIRNERLPLFGAVDRSQMPGGSSSTLSVFTNGMLRRSPSVLSKAPSESPSNIRGRTADTVRSNGKWSNKARSRPRLYPNSTLGSSRTSLDDQSSMWSPSASSSTWSKYSLGKHTSMSVDSLSSAWQGDYQQSIGFANALSQAIIREETVHSSGSRGSDHEELRVAPLLDDESLELAGAPWAKEGMVKHKHHLEALDKKAKDRNWNETFAVIEKGYMSLFSFSSKSLRHKTKGKSSGGVVGGGNWQENAESLGSFLLRQTIASALPSPGYSKARPHVWALSLPTGAVHLFQVGTADIVKEFVTTANYWSARLSNHPLVGGISNIEYGWSDEIVNNALVTAINEQNTRPSTSGARPSMQSSLRSSLDHGYVGGVRSRLPGDRIAINDWSPPIQSMRASNLMEPDQLKTLTDYVQSIEEELQKHNNLRSPMLLAYTPRHPNAQKAMANWEKKSSYLLREIVKFTTYIDSLHAAETGRQRIYAERAAHQAVAERKDEDEEGEEGEGNTTLTA